jgi:hypothetical protein
MKCRQWTEIGRKRPSWWVCVACAALGATLAACNTSDTPEGSSSSHWLHCNSDSPCEEYDATCGSDGICKDDAGDPISVTGSNIGTSNGDDTSDDDVASTPPELVDCDPLARWQRSVQPTDPIVVAKDSAGVVYAVTPFDSNYLVWRSRGNRLEPLRVRGSGSGGGQLSLVVQDDSDEFTLLVSPETNPTDVTFFAGMQDKKEPDPALGDALEVVAASVLSDFRVAPIDVPVHVETHASESTGSKDDIEVVLLSPDWAGGYEDFRLFYGTGGTLTEVAINDVVRERSVDGSTLVDFVSPSGQATTLSYSTGGGASLSTDPASDTWLPLWQRSSTDLGLAGLSFQCLEPVNRRFEASGAPVELPTLQCNERVRMGGCITPAAGSDGVSNPSLDVTGTVTSLGTGVPPEDATLANGDPQGCPFGYDGTLRFGDIAQTSTDRTVVDELHWLHVEYDGGDTWLVLRIPDLNVSWNAGDSMHLIASASLDFGGAIDSAVELRDENDELLVWLGQSYTLDELDVPAELSLSTGWETCSLSNTCALDYGYYTIAAELGPEAATAAQGEGFDLGDYHFVNSAFQVQTAAFVCTDSSADFIRLALFRK